MPFSEKAEQIFKEFLYQKNRNKNKKGYSSKDKGAFFTQFSEMLDEMEDYMDEKIKEYHIFKKK
jgi:SNF2 family DNA or RNA helicase